MKVLYIDTSSSFLYSGIVEDDKLLCEVKKEFGKNLSEETLPEIENLFKKVNLNPNNIDKIIVVNGPGSFTGIRIGITIAKVYAWALKKDIITIKSLEAMSLSSNNNKVRIPMIDARRKYIYGAIYDEKNKVLYEPKHILLEEFKKEISKYNDYEIISNNEFDDFNNISNYNPNILNIVINTMNRKPINPHKVNPDYLKLTEAEESKR